MPRGRARARPALSLDLSGMLAVLGGPRTAVLTFGGPRFGLSIGEFGVGVSAYPSLLYSRLWATDRLRPTLGFGGEIGYCGATAVVAVYYIGERYVPAVGLGYRFVLRRQITRKRRGPRTPDDRDAP